MSAIVLYFLNSTLFKSEWKAFVRDVNQCIPKRNVQNQPCQTRRQRQKLDRLQIHWNIRRKNPQPLNKNKIKTVLEIW